MIRNANENINKKQVFNLYFFDSKNRDFP